LFGKGWCFWRFKKETIVHVRYLSALLLATVCAFADDTEETPYDLIRPVWPLSWDSTEFNKFDTTVTTKKNMVPKNRTPAAFKPNTIIPDTLNQAYLDNLNMHISPIRINQAGYLLDDLNRQFYYIDVGSKGNVTGYTVVNASDSAVGTGTLTNSGVTTSSTWKIVAGTNAATNDKERYQVSDTISTGSVMVGHLPTDLPTDERLRVKVTTPDTTYYSATFIISAKLYSMVRDASIKFFGINRSGDSQSWFHPKSHWLDGQDGTIVNNVTGTASGLTKKGDLTGGWYDCGDHLKESQTMAFAFMTLAETHAANPDRDDDHYAYDQSETVNTDGVPDILREAKHGADFFLKSYRLADGVIDNMAVSVGNFGDDHGWWGRPENQDYIPSTVTGRGGPYERDIRLGELGSNISSEIAAGLAILSKDYAIYDRPFADSCLMVAKQLYDFAKNLELGNSTYGDGKYTFVNNKTAAGWSSSAYNGNNEDYDDLGAAAIALLYATKDTSYLNDAVENTALAGGQTKASFSSNKGGAGSFRGGWFVRKEASLLKSGKNTSWANAYTYALYSFYKLILQNADSAATYGITTKRLEYIEDVLYTLAANLGDMSSTGTAIQLPQGALMWKGASVSYDPTWYTMFTDGTWIYNRYQMGNIFDVLSYADVAKDIGSTVLPQNGAQNWKGEEMYELGINQLNYMLGENPWDVSFILGIGDKNDAHPHHRGSNPEGKNVAGAAYSYVPPTGALFGGVKPGTTNDWAPSTMSWEDYQLSETCVDAAALLMCATTEAAYKDDHLAAPTTTVEIRYVGLDSAIITVKTSLRSNVTLTYSTSETLANASTATDGSASVAHTIVLRGLTNGTTYYFTATAANATSGNTTVKYLVDSTQTPFSFTTLNSQTSAEITNVKVCNVTADSAEIMWYTPNGSYDSKVYWDTVLTTYDKMTWNTGDTNADVSGIPTQFHYVKIGGLKEQTTYYFTVESDGAVRSVDDSNNVLKFTTPVTQYDFDVRTYQYAWQGMAGININIYNDEARPFDSLTVRVYMRGPDTLGKDIGIRMDICQAYNEAGFNKSCDAATVTELTTLFRKSHPVKLTDTYNATDGTWQYYFPIPLGSTVIKSSSRLRIDVLFDHRSQYLNADGSQSEDLMNEDPNKKLYCIAGSTWYHPDDASAASTLTANPGDWSWEPHTIAGGDRSDYTGLPCEDKDAGDIDFNVAPTNPYVAVYRKDQFVWGYSPSYTEMTTKVAKYDITLTLDSPFNVSNGSNVTLDQASSTVHVTGTALITEGGYITSIWVNGTKLSDISSVAVYNAATGLWDLDIPVKMTIGTNKVDVTIFAGPDPTCTACTENGGCAFVNRTYYVNFSKGTATASTLTLKTVADTTVAVSSPAEPGKTNFYIYVRDQDKKSQKTITALVYNAKKSDTLTVTLSAIDTLGNFRSSAISAVSSLSHSSNEIAFFGGDTIYVVYTDPDDSDDVSKQSFYAKATYPTPQYALAQDKNCDGTADNLEVAFSNTFDGSVTLDSILVKFAGTTSTDGDTFTVAITSAMQLNQSTIDIPLTRSTIPETATPSGTIVAYMTTIANGESSTETATIKDGIAPKLQSVTLLENPTPRSAQDTVKISFSEKVVLGSAAIWPLSVTDANGNTVSQSSISIVGKATTEDNGKSWTYVIEGNTDGKVLDSTYTATISSGFSVTDLALNALGSACDTAVKVAITPKPVAVTLAEMRDATGDGYPDELYLKFAKKLRAQDMLDSFVVSWGSPAVIKSFLPATWKETVEIGDPYTVTTISGTDTTTTTKQDTISILTITIPSSQQYALGTTSGDDDGYGAVTPRLGPEGGFFDKSYSVVDKCAPIIMTASLNDNSESIDNLTVIMSEPLDSIATGTHYLQRKRGSDLMFFAPQYSARASSKNKQWNYYYGDDDNNAIHVGDYVRLISDETISKYKDVAGNFAGSETPWVIVKGSSSKVHFSVTMKTAVTQPRSGVYGTEPADGEQFRLTVLSNATETLIASGKGELTKATSAATSDSSAHSGPTFDLKIRIPAAVATTTDGTRVRTYYVSFSADLFDNIGHYVNTASYSFPLSDIGYDKLSSDGTLTLRLEWVAHNGMAPAAESGKLVGSGAYISKFDFKAKSLCNVKDTDSGCKAKGQADKNSDNVTRTFGLRRAAK
jgi:hypothetical protein